MRRHFSSALVSNFQSAVAKVVARPQSAAGAKVSAADLRTPVLDFNNDMVRAAAVVGEAVQKQLAGQTAAAPAVAAAPPPAAAAALAPAPAVAGPVECARAAFDLACARVAGDAAAADEAAAKLVDFGTCDARWGECVAEFVAHYTLAKHGDVPYVRYRSMDDFVLPVPDQCKVAIIGDWGTGAARANGLIRHVAAENPDLLVHLGDIYYSCTASEANVFYKNLFQVFPDLPRRPPTFTLCGNHDMYAGGAPYYALLSRIDQPASFFCLRNDSWQLLALDTGYNDFNPLAVDNSETWVQDHDDGDAYSELDWHRDKLRSAASGANRRKTILLSHHQPFSRNAPIGKSSAVNEKLMGQFSEFFPQIAVWLWGHEHNQVIYKEFRGLEKGRCVGASAVPVVKGEDLYAVAKEFLNKDGSLNQKVPDLIDGNGWRLTVDQKSDLWNLGYAILSLDGQAGKARYYEYDSSIDESALRYEEDL